MGLTLNVSLMIECFKPDRSWVQLFNSYLIQ